MFASTEFCGQVATEFRFKKRGHISLSLNGEVSKNCGAIFENYHTAVVTKKILRKVAIMECFVEVMAVWQRVCFVGYLKGEKATLTSRWQYIHAFF